MRKQTYCRVVVPVLIAVLAAALPGCSSGPAAAPPQPAPGARGARGPRGGATGAAGMPSQQPLAQLAQLGVIGKPSRTEPQGLLVEGFTPSSEPWPLEILGVEKGDVIVSCNGQQGQMGRRLITALEVLEQQGEPITLEIIRDGKRVKLERTEKLSGTSTDSGSE